MVNQPPDLKHYENLSGEENLKDERLKSVKGLTQLLTPESPKNLCLS